MCSLDDAIWCSAVHFTTELQVRLWICRAFQNHKGSRDSPLKRLVQPCSYTVTAKSRRIFSSSDNLLAATSCDRPKSNFKAPNSTVFLLFCQERSCSFRRGCVHCNLTSEITSKERAKERMKHKKQQRAKIFHIRYPFYISQITEGIFNLMGHKGIFFVSLLLPLFSVLPFFPICSLYCEADRQFTVHCSSWSSHDFTKNGN